MITKGDLSFRMYRRELKKACNVVESIRWRNLQWEVYVSKPQKTIALTNAFNKDLQQAYLSFQREDVSSIIWNMHFAGFWEPAFGHHVLRWTTETIWNTLFVWWYCRNSVFHMGNWKVLSSKRGQLRKKEETIIKNHKPTEEGLNWNQWKNKTGSGLVKKAS